MSDTLFIDTVMSEVTNTFVLPDGTTITDVGEYESLLSYING